MSTAIAKVQTSIRVDSDLWERFGDHAQRLGISTTAALEDAMRAALSASTDVPRTPYERAFVGGALRWLRAKRAAFKPEMLPLLEKLFEVQE